MKTTAETSPTPESLIEYPSLFPIKVLGLNHPQFVTEITHLAKQFDTEFDASKIALRNSSSDNYLSITITIKATSREQLDNLYRALSAHSMVKFVL